MKMPCPKKEQGMNHLSFHLHGPHMSGAALAPMDGCLDGHGSRTPNVESSCLTFNCMIIIPESIH